MKQALTSIIVLLFAGSIYGQTDNLTGAWKADSISETKILKSGAVQKQSFREMPQSPTYMYPQGIEINSNSSVVLTLKNSRKINPASSGIDNNVLTVTLSFMGRRITYQFIRKGSKLVLRHSFNDADGNTVTVETYYTKTQSN